MCSATVDSNYSYFNIGWLLSLNRLLSSGMITKDPHSHLSRSSRSLDLKLILCSKEIMMKMASCTGSVAIPSECVIAILETPFFVNYSKEHNFLECIITRPVTSFMIWICWFGHFRTAFEWVNPAQYGLVVVTSSEGKNLPYGKLEDILSRDSSALNCHTNDDK